MGKWTITTTTKHTTPQHYNMYKNKNNINQQGNDGGNEIKKKKQASNIYIYIYEMPKVQWTLFPV